MSNTYCDTLGIQVPSIETVRDHREANIYALLIVALLERGGPMTLEEVALRLATAGVGSPAAALRSLQRCRPARAPVYREDDRYLLDPHDDELDLWVFRLGLRPPRVPPLRVVRPEPAPLPGNDVPLALDELTQVMRDANLYSWSAQRVALAVLDAHGHPMAPADVVAFTGDLTRWHGLSAGAARYWRSGAIRFLDDGTWTVTAGHDALHAARCAVRERLGALRRMEAMRPDPALFAARRRHAERLRAARAAELARLRRVLVHAFPAAHPQAVTIVDPASRELATYLGDEMEIARQRLADYDLIGAVDVRPLLRALGFEPGDRRLAELAPPQKTMRLNRRGRVLKITNTLLIRGSCGISQPFGDPKKLRRYLQAGQTTRLRRRIEADAKSLAAIYQYGRLHGAVRLRWGFLDEMLPVPWVHRVEPRLYELMHQAAEHGEMLDVVCGSAPGWKDPWARVRSCYVIGGSRDRLATLVGEDGFPVDERDVQLARLAGG